MKINDTRKGKIVPFKEIRRGEFFEYNNELFFRVQDINMPSIIQGFGYKEVLEINAISLEHGDDDLFSSDTLVHKVEVEIVIK